MNNRQTISTFLGFAAAVVLAANSHAADINVPGDELTIQAGIDAAVNGDVVIVAQGEYFENINFNGKAITVRSTDPNDAGVVLNTIINGGGSGTVVICSSGEGSDTVLSGFVITGGNAVDGGGGMLNAGSSRTGTSVCWVSRSTCTPRLYGHFHAPLCRLRYVQMRSGGADSTSARSSLAVWNSDPATSRQRTVSSALTTRRNRRTRSPNDRARPSSRSVTMRIDSTLTRS